MDTYWAVQVGFEPTRFSLTGSCSAVELHAIVFFCVAISADKNALLSLFY